MIMYYDENKYKYPGMKKNKEFGAKSIFGPIPHQFCDIRKFPGLSMGLTAWLNLC